MIVSLEMTHVKYLVGRLAHSAVCLILATPVLPSRCRLIEVSTGIAAWSSSAQRFGLGPPGHLKITQDPKELLIM